MVDIMREMKITQYLGAVCILGQDWYAGVTKESCKQVEAVFKDCKYPSCADERLTQRLFDLQPGTKMKPAAEKMTASMSIMKIANSSRYDV